MLDLINVTYTTDRKRVYVIEHYADGFVYKWHAILSMINGQTEIRCLQYARITGYLEHFVF